MGRDIIVFHTKDTLDIAILAIYDQCKTIIEKFELDVCFVYFHTRAQELLGDKCTSQFLVLKKLDIIFKNSAEMIEERCSIRK